MTLVILCCLLQRYYCKFISLTYILSFYMLIYYLISHAQSYAHTKSDLNFETILSCGATSRTLLHDAMPLLKTLRIDKPEQINLTVASRFRDIKEIHINSLFTSETHDVVPRMSVQMLILIWKVQLE